MRRLLVSIAAGLLAIAWLATPAVQAGIIVQYTFTPATGAPSNWIETGAGYSPTTTDPGLDTLTNMAVHDGGANIKIEISNPTTSYSTQPVLRIDPLGQTPGTTSVDRLNAAVTNGVYWEFTVKPAAGMVLNLADLQFKAGKGGAGARGLGVQATASGLGVGGTMLSSGDIPTTRPTWTDYNIDLSGPLFQGLTTEQTFRFYVYAPATGNTLEFDNVTLNGTLTPEPATLILMGLGAGAMLLRRRQ